MKKRILLGSVIAFACLNAGFAADTSTLEEAVKKINVSGFLRYRHTNERFENIGFQNGDNGTGSGKAGSQHSWRSNVDFSMIPVDYVAMNLGFVYSQSSTTNTNDFTGTGLGGSRDTPFSVSTFYATITPPGTNTKINAGKVRFDSPINDTTDDRFTGVVLTNNDLQGVTLGAAIFDSWSLDDGVTIMPDTAGNTITKTYYSLQAGVDMQGVTAKAMYAGVQDYMNYMFYLSAGYEMPFFHIKGEYAFSQLKDDIFKHINPDMTTYKDHSLYTIEAGVNFSPASLRVGYIGSGADGYKVSLDNQGEFQMAGTLWNDFSATGIGYSALSSLPTYKEQLSVIYASAAVSLLDQDALKFALDYVTGKNKMKDLNDERTFHEIMPSVSYQYNANLSLLMYYAMLTVKKEPNDGVTYADTKQNKLRLQALYKF